MISDAPFSVGIITRRKRQITCDNTEDLVYSVGMTCLSKACQEEDQWVVYYPMVIVNSGMLPPHGILHVTIKVKSLT